MRPKAKSKRAVLTNSANGKPYPMSTNTDNARGETDLDLPGGDRATAHVLQNTANELVNALDDYIKLLGEELHDFASFAATHNIGSKRIELGKQGRGRIDNARRDFCRAQLECSPASGVSSENPAPRPLREGEWTTQIEEDLAVLRAPGNRQWYFEEKELYRLQSICLAVNASLADSKDSARLEALTEAARHALLVLATFKVTGKEMPYVEIAPYLWTLMMETHDEIIAALSPQPTEQDKPKNLE